PRALAAAATALPNEWSMATIQQAIPAIRELAERTGGLRAGQMIFAGAAVAGAFAYGLWWPWGDGVTTSLRVGLGGTGVREDTLQRLRDVFNVEL
ncbi:MAG: hypothetical protein ACREJ3_02840, partial [Polyangiaceae bacterium]